VNEHSPAQLAFRSRCYAAVLVAAALSAGCTEHLDTTRVVPARGTLGDEIYRVLCERLAREHDPADVTGDGTRDLCHGRVGAAAAPSPRLRALAERRAALVGALDRVLPEELEDDLDQALVDMLPLYDLPAERMPKAARAFAEALAATAADAEALDALDRLRSRAGYRPLVQALGIVRPLLSYDGFDAFAEKTVRTIVTDDEANAAWNTLLRASALSLANAAVEPTLSGEESTFTVAHRLLSARSEALGIAIENPIARRDPRGIVRVQRRGLLLPEPFVDTDLDGLADVNARDQFVDAQGVVLRAPAPFVTSDATVGNRDALGRALAGDGWPLYEYIDANQTLMAGLTRELSTLTDPDAPVLLDLASGLPRAIGPFTERTTTIGAASFTHTGFDTQRSPLLDLTHAYGAVLASPASDDVHLVLRRLLDDHEAVVAGLIESGLLIDAYSDAHDADLEPGSVLWDDILEAAGWMAKEPGLTEAVLRALADPNTSRLGAVVADFMRHRDFVAPLSIDPNRLLVDAQIQTPVDRTKPNTHDNQSLFQRIAAIIHDFDQSRVCNKEGAQVGVTAPLAGFVTLPLRFEECGLVRIDNMARMFSQSVIGRANIRVADSRIQAIGNATASLGIGFLTIDEIFQRESDITGLDTSPTPGALARMAFLPQNKFMTNLFAPVLTRDGVPVDPRHDATLFACEKKYNFNDGRYPAEASFYDAIGPMLRAFDDYDRGTYGPHIAPGAASERFIFGEFISALHLHWPDSTSDFTQSSDPNAPSYATADGAHRYEEILAYAMDDAQLVLRLHELAKALDTMQVRAGVDGIDVLARGLETMLAPIRDEGVTYRDGSVTTTTNDGARTIDATRLHLFLDALNGVDRAFEGADGPLARWRRGRSGLVDVWFGTNRVGGTPVIENRRSVEVLRTLLDFIDERVTDHKTRGDREAWALGLSGRLEQTLADPVLASILVLMDTIQRDPESIDAFAGVIKHLSDADYDTDAFNTTTATLVDIFQLLEDDETLVPLLRAASHFVAPNARAVVDAGGEVDLGRGSVGATVELISDLQAHDQNDVMLEVLRRLVAIDPASRKTDLEVLVDALTEVHRAAPGAGTPLTREDDLALLGRASDFLGSEEHGLARLFDVIQSRKRR
jgi:hypothetical protein